MRKIVYVILIAVGAFMSHSCAYILDKEPISSLNTGNYWQTDADINSAVSAMYVSFASAMARGYGLIFTRQSIRLRLLSDMYRR